MAHFPVAVVDGCKRAKKSTFCRRTQTFATSHPIEGLENSMFELPRLIQCMPYVQQCHLSVCTRSLQRSTSLFRLKGASKRVRKERFAQMCLLSLHWHLLTFAHLRVAPNSSQTEALFSALILNVWTSVSLDCRTCRTSMSCSLQSMQIKEGRTETRDLGCIGCLEKQFH